MNAKKDFQDKASQHILDMIKDDRAPTQWSFSPYLNRFIQRNTDPEVVSDWLSNHDIDTQGMTDKEVRRIYKGAIERKQEAIQRLRTSNLPSLKNSIGFAPTPPQSTPTPQTTMPNKMTDVRDTLYKSRQKTVPQAASVAPVPEPVTNPPATPTPSSTMQQTPPQQPIKTVKQAMLEEDPWNSPSIPPTQTPTTASYVAVPKAGSGLYQYDAWYQSKMGYTNPVASPHVSQATPVAPGVTVNPTPQPKVQPEVEATTPTPINVENTSNPNPKVQGEANGMDKVTKGMGLDWKGVVGLGAATIMTVGILNSMAQSRQREEARKRNQRLMSYGQMPDSFQ